MPASVTGSKTSRARNTIATMITKTSSLLSNDEYGVHVYTPTQSSVSSKSLRSCLRLQFNRSEPQELNAILNLVAATYSS